MDVARLAAAFAGMQKGEHAENGPAFALRFALRLRGDDTAAI
jgi:hypothetical protein